MMPKSYLLDTNAYFNILKYASLGSDQSNPTAHAINEIKGGSNYISALTQIEIISVIGKYARGNNGGKHKCNCVISQSGETCDNYRFSNTQRPWKKKQILWWLKLVENTINGTSPVLNVSVIPLTDKGIAAAQEIVKHALIHNFGSVDAIIAATAKEFSKDKKDSEIITITSDKGLKACLGKCELKIWDVFNSQTQLCE